MLAPTLHPLSDITEALLAAIAEHEVGRLPQAEAGYAAILAREPEQPQALYFSGLLALQGGRAEAAVTLLRRAATVRPGHADSHFGLGNALWLAGQRAAAEAAWQAALAVQPRHLPALLHLAKAREEAGATQDAIGYCERAITLAPRDALAHAALASALLASGQNDAALAAAQQALALRDDVAQGWFQYGTVLKALRRWDDAAAALQRALTLNRLSLLEIAIANGFGSQDNFTRVFRKSTGLTPRQFRDLSRSGCS